MKHLFNIHTASEQELAILGQLDKNTELHEMAKLGNLPQGLVIYVWTNDGGNIPHFHIGDEATFPNCTEFSTSIKIEKAEYFPHGGHYNDKLNNKLRRALANWMKSVSRRGTNYDKVVEAWNDNNSSTNIGPNQKMPDYSKLK